MRAGHRRHPHHHRPGQADARGPLRPQLRARVLPGAEGQDRRARRDPGAGRDGRHPLRAPGRAARPRPRRVGGPQARGRQPVRRACSATTSWIAARPCSTSMISTYEQYGRSVDRPLGVPARGDLVLRLRQARAGHRSSWSACSTSSRSRQPADAPSNLAVMGRYVFTPEIFDALEQVQPGRRRRDPAHRRHRHAARRPDGVRLRVQRRPLRHRQEARLPAGHGRARARPRRPGSRVPAFLVETLQKRGLV